MVDLIPLSDEISSILEKIFECKTFNDPSPAKVELKLSFDVFMVHNDFDGSTIVREAMNVDSAIVDMSIGLVELFDEQVYKDDDDLMASHGVDTSKFSVDSLTVQIDEDFMAPQGEVESKFSVDSLPVEHFEVKFETSVNSFTNVDELADVNVNIDKSFELIKLFEEPEIITFNNIIDLD